MDKLNSLEEKNVELIKKNEKVKNRCRLRRKLHLLREKERREGILYSGRPQERGRRRVKAGTGWKKKIYIYFLNNE